MEKYKESKHFKNKIPNTSNLSSKLKLFIVLIVIISLIAIISIVFIKSVKFCSNLKIKRKLYSSSKYNDDENIPSTFGLVIIGCYTTTILYFCILILNVYSNGGDPAHYNIVFIYGFIINIVHVLLDVIFLKTKKEQLVGHEIIAVLFIFF